jgi:hypothetical protein
VPTDAVHCSMVADFSVTEGDLSDFVQLTMNGSNKLIKVDTDPGT